MGSYLLRHQEQNRQLIHVINVIFHLQVTDINALMRYHLTISVSQYTLFYILMSTELLPNNYLFFEKGVWGGVSCLKRKQYEDSLPILL